MIHDPLHILIITDKEHMKFFFIALNGVDIYVAVAGIRLVKNVFPNYRFVFFDDWTCLEGR